MLLPRSHGWTPLQRSLIIAAVVFAAIAAAASIYHYERYYRGPSDNVLFGTWQCTSGCYYPLYYQFTPDHNVRILDNEDTSMVALKGRWYAGGDFIYFRFPEEELKRKRDIIIWRIEDIAPNEFRARMWKDDPPRIYKRVALASPHI